MAQIVIYRTGYEPLVHEIYSGATTIGKLDDNRLVIPDGSVSAHHAEIVADEDSYFMRDLNSSNGTTINGESCLETKLGNGDKLCFGAVQGMFVDDSKPMITSGTRLRTNANVIMESCKTWSSRLVLHTQKAWIDAKKIAELFFLKAQIEKLEMIDLANSQFALGEKAYEFKVKTDQFQSIHMNLTLLEDKIHGKRINVPVGDRKTVVEKTKWFTIEIKSAIDVRLLLIKQRSNFISLGSVLMNTSIIPELAFEAGAVVKNNQQIEQLKCRYRERLADVRRADRSQLANRWLIVASLSTLLLGVLFVEMRVRDTPNTVTANMDKINDARSANSVSSPTVTTVPDSDFDVERVKTALVERGYTLQYADNDPNEDFFMVTPRNCAVWFKRSQRQVKSIEIHTMAFDVDAKGKDEAMKKVALGYNEVCDVAVVVDPKERYEIKKWYSTCTERGFRNPHFAESNFFGPFLYNYKSNGLDAIVTIWRNR